MKLKAKIVEEIGPENNLVIVQFGDDKIIKYNTIN